MTKEQFKLKLAQEHTNKIKECLNELVDKLNTNRILKKDSIKYYSERHWIYDELFTYSEDCYKFHIENKLNVTTSSLLKFKLKEKYNISQ